jgi:hypothetical protein
MPFNTLLLTCLLPGTTSFSESGVSVNVQPQSGETVLFFCVDSQSNPDCGLRQKLSLLGENCDLIIFYIRKNKRVVCFVELKGTELEKAAKQIKNIHQHLEQFLRQSLQSAFFEQVEWKACIRQHQSAPTNKIEQKQAITYLEQAFERDKITITRNSDLGQFLRR